MQRVTILGLIQGLGLCGPKINFASVWCYGLILALAGMPGWSADINQEQLDKLKGLAAIVGSWQGTGTSSNSAGWKEKVDVLWGYRDSDGRVSLNFYVEGGTIIQVGLLAYDLESKQYQFIMKNTKDEVLRFAGTPEGQQTLRLDRVEADGADGSASDKLDRIEIQLLRGADKVRYRFQEKKTASFYKTFAEVELFRQDESYAQFVNGPFCIMTGGPGRVQVDYQGQKIPLACSNTKAEFLKRPEFYLEQSKKNSQAK